MTGRPVLAAAAATALVTALSAGCATTAPATLAPTTASAQPSPTAVLTPGDSDCRVDAPPPGFPTDLLPVPPGATQLQSCATLADGFWEVSLNVRTTQDVTGLLDAVRQPLLAAGFAERSDPLPAGVAAQSTFSRAEGEVLTGTVLDDGTTRTLTLGGSVVAQASDQTSDQAPDGTPDGNG